MIRRVVLLVLGIALILGGVVLGAGAWVVQSAFDGTGRMLIPVGIIRAGDARTVIVDIDRYSAAPALVGSILGPLGHARLAFHSSAGPVTVLAGDSERVDSAIRGSSYAVARRQGSGWQTVTVPGTDGTGDLAARGEWLATAQGSTPELALPDHRPLTLVVTGASPLRDVSAMAVFALAGHRAIILGLAVAGVVLLVIGGTVVVLGARSTAARARHARGDVPA